MPSKTRVAIPVESGDGMDAVRSAHFGHAAGFVLVDTEDGAPVSAHRIDNPPHTHGGCTSIVSVLVTHGVDTVSVIGMGRGPLNGLMGAGVTVHHDPESTTVAEAISAINEGRTSAFVPDHACQGH
jgi:predicted Fe-Mo cluster-binding NifX family protein